ncbi:diacylglycerol kinase [Vibrio sp. NTOU-M3]|uniref:diacylglycerol kinase n=1 Tax=Vibrio sp. NTOU-M3 TaxID=3234954 RepID=UPI00349F70B4
MKPGKTGITRVIHATQYSMKGLVAAWLHEAAFRQETVLSAALFLVAIWLPVTPVEKLLLIGSVLLVLIVELLNSAVEAVVDRVGSEWHELSGRAKDMGSAAVFIALGFALLTWGAIVGALL